MTGRRMAKSRRRQRGQSLVEFALVLPVLLFMTLGVVEMGFAIAHNSTMVTATRQAARVGSQQVNGSPTRKQPDNTPAGIAAAANVDPLIIGAIEGVLLSPGSPTTLSEVVEIDIFQATDSGGVSGGNLNKWIPGAGPVLPGSSPATNLHFTPASSPWDPKTRTGAATAQNIGVRIIYKYNMITPLGNLLSAFGSGTITMTDQTIMAMEPPAP